MSRPKLREGVEAAVRQSAKELRKVAPHLARRLMVVAGDLKRIASDDLSTAVLELAGDDDANDDSQDTNSQAGIEHGTLAFFGTDKARSDQLTAKKKARRKAAEEKEDEENEDPEEGREASPTSWNNESPDGMDPELDAPPAPGTGGFATDSKKPLMDTMNADDVKVPSVRDASHVLVNPKGVGIARGSFKSLKAFAEKGFQKGKIASLKGWRIRPTKKPRTSGRKASPIKVSSWGEIKKAFKSIGEIGGTFNGGRFAAQIRDYGKTVEIEAVAHDREGIPRTAGSVSVTLIHEAPGGRFATLEINDPVIESRSTQATIRPSHAREFAKQWVKSIAGTARELLNS